MNRREFFKVSAGVVAMGLGVPAFAGAKAASAAVSSEPRFMLIAGPSKSGKTLLAIEAIVASISGRTFLNKIPVQRGNVGFCGEMPFYKLDEKLRKMLPAMYGKQHEPKVYELPIYQIRNIRHVVIDFASPWESEQQIINARIVNLWEALRREGISLTMTAQTARVQTNGEPRGSSYLLDYADHRVLIGDKRYSCCKSSGLRRITIDSRDYEQIQLKGDFDPKTLLYKEKVS